MDEQNPGRRLQSPALPVDGTQLRELRRTPSGVLQLFLEGRELPVDKVTVRPCFPWSAPDAYVSVLDGTGQEVAWIRSLDEVRPELRDVLREELRTALFHPVIQRIVSHRNEFGVLSLDVETDRGRTRFQVRSRDDVRFLSDRRVLLRDPDGIVYEIPDLSRLDTASRRGLEEFL